MYVCVNVCAYVRVFVYICTCYDKTYKMKLKYHANIHKPNQS